MRGPIPWTPEQEAILSHPPDAHALVRAVPGSGKTTTLVGLVERLCAAGVEPSGVRVVMFNKAIATHFQERLGARGIADVRVSTFDSLGLQVVRAAERRGLLTRELIVDVGSSSSLARRVRKRLSKDIQDDEDLIDAITFWKAHLVSPKRARFKGNEPLVDGYALFESLRLGDGRLRVGFADMVYTAVGILREHPRLLGRVSHFLVDEFQDVNLARVELLRRLSSAETSIIAVGDEDQGINEWGGAHPRYIQDFAGTFPWRQVREYPLSRSFRFGATIATAAATLIRRNEGREGLEIVGAGASEGVIRGASDICSTIRELVAEGVSRPEIAVLYRAREQGVGVLAELAAAKIPMETEDFERLRSSRAAALVATYLRLATSDAPAEMDDAWRIAFAPDRFIAKERFARQLKRRRGRLSSVLADRALAESLGQSSTAVDAMAELSRTLELIRWATSTQEAIDVLVEHADLEAQLSPPSASERRRERNAAELAAVLRLFSSLDVAPAAAEGALKALDPSAGASPEGRVWVSTIHKAKGREWRCVLLPRLAEGLCPAERRGEALPGTETEPEGIAQSSWTEQERRIFYVGLTRASERVFLQASASAPSRFLEELRPSLPGRRGGHTAVGAKPSPSPRASGSRWTVDADRALIDAWATDAGLEAIAARCGRSVTAIVRRVVRLGLVKSAGEARARPRV
ncbi:MAG: ATP-dependent helicase [Myxococcales bacterium]|nr:ATP-dependent helicase [Myxococcales bacterium]